MPLKVLCTLIILMHKVMIILAAFSIKVNTVARKESGNNKLYYQLLNNNAMDMRVAKHNNCEDQRIQGTMNNKLQMWFDN